MIWSGPNMVLISELGASLTENGSSQRKIDVK
jgi:hypothetical protein